MKQKIKEWLRPLKERSDRLRTVKYLRERGVEWTGVAPHFDIVSRPPIFAIYGKFLLGSGTKFLTHMGDIRVQVDEQAFLHIGNHVVINSGVWIRSTLYIWIGDYVRIGPGVMVLDSNLHPISPSDLQLSQQVIIGRNAILFGGCCILKGVKIGEHSVVGTGAVVTHDVPPKSEVAGIPAKVIKTFECPDDWIRP